jgi:choline dehydrogenase-like flavoprotein
MDLGNSASPTYNYIIVGSGAAGSVLAYLLGQDRLVGAVL